MDTEMEARLQGALDEVKAAQADYLAARANAPTPVAIRRRRDQAVAVFIETLKAALDEHIVVISTQAINTGPALSLVA
ncbi:MAG TPA: hypothetical protein VFB38_17125 [Chthonomonadaceae bacterium]|nr:hypothetical protein [Chthonomonadaceae bacterium]